MTAIRDDEPTTAALRADVAALTERVTNQNSRINRIEQELKSVLAKAREDRQEARNIIDMFGPVPSAIDRLHEHDRDASDRLDQIEAHLFRYPAPTPPPAAAPDEAAHLIAYIRDVLDCWHPTETDMMANIIVAKAIALGLAAPADRAVVTNAGDRHRAAASTYERLIAEYPYMADAVPVSSDDYRDALLMAMAFAYRDHAPADRAVVTDAMVDAAILAHSLKHSAYRMPNPDVMRDYIEAALRTAPAGADTTGEGGGD